VSNPRAPSAPSPGLRDEQVVVVAAVREAGALAIGYYGRDMAVSEKRPGQVVCAADIAVNALLAKALRAPRPAYGWLSEEDEDDARRLDARRIWVVDPSSPSPRRSWIRARRSRAP
jgi:myo-inositol-1(or 4)-monophosphatase